MRDVRTRVALSAVTIDLFFASLPLAIVIFAHLIHPSRTFHFLDSPDTTMAACVVYGLTLSRIIQSGPNNISNDEAAKATSALLGLLGLIPITGLLGSALLTTGIVSHSIPGGIAGIIQIVNFCVSAAVFTLVGGYAVYRSEG